MSQDYTVDCFATDHAVQTDMLSMEKNFECLRSGFSGSTAPSNPIAGTNPLINANTKEGIAPEKGPT